MKELEDVKIADFLKLRIGKVRKLEGREFAYRIWPSVKALINTGKGKIIDLKEDQDGPWPTVDDFKQNRQAVYMKAKHRFEPVTSHLVILLNKETNFKHRVCFEYIGDGKVVLYITAKVKKPKKEIAAV